MADNQDVSSRQGCAGQSIVCFLGKKAPIGSHYQLPWCKYSHWGQLPATIVMSVSRLGKINILLALRMVRARRHQLATSPAPEWCPLFTVDSQVCSRRAGMQAHRDIKWINWKLIIIFHVRARSVVSDSWRPHGLWPARPLCPWNLPGKKTRMRCHFLLQGLFPTQGLNLCLLSLLH